MDAGANEEVVSVTAVDATTFSAVFAKSHVNGAPVTALGNFRDGILSATTDTTVLKLYGDINGDGSLVYVEYNYDINAQTLSRSVTPVTTGGNAAVAQTTPGILLRDLQANPGNTPCFRYRTRTEGGIANITEVWVTLSKPDLVLPLSPSARLPLCPAGATPIALTISCGPHDFCPI